MAILRDQACFPLEAELLLLCARLELNIAERQRLVQLLATDLDWAWTVDLAARHGLRPLVYRHLDATAPDVVPRHVLVELWSLHQRRSRSNQAMAEELLRILQVFDSHAIPAIPYKGPALAAAVYGDVALREFGDLDILLRRQDVVAAKALLLTAGYQTLYALTPAVEAAFLRSPAQYHLVLIHRESQISVELHWMTDPDFPVEPSADDGWWKNLGVADLGEGKVRCFSARELLLILCLHGSKHYWASLGWLVDVAELMRVQPPADWDWIFGQARRMACERRVALGLNLAHRLLDAPLPPDMQRRIAAVRGVEELSTQLVATFFARDGAAWNSLGSLRLNLRLYERWHQRVRHVVNNLFSPSLAEWSRWPLPRVFHGLYLPLRLVRLAGKYTATLFRLGRSTH